MNPSTVAPRSPRIARLATAALATIMLAGGTLVATSGSAQAATEYPTTFLSTAATTWSYSDNNTDPSNGNADRLSWTKASFNDDAWKNAKGAFGAKRGAATGLGAGFPITTKLSQYVEGSSAVNVKTFHFRTSFTLTADQLTGMTGLTGSVTYDDALQIFVNGTKVGGFVDARVEAAPEAERNLVYAGESGGDPATSTLEIPAGALVAGENTVSVALYQDRATSSDIYFDLKSLAPVFPVETPAPNAPATLSDLVLTIGATEKERNVTWYSDIDTAQEVQFAPASTQTGNAFPVDASTSSAATGGVTTSGEFRRSANIAGLAENTTYVYRVGSEKNGWSDSYKFSTASFTGDYDFLFLGDPQIGASRNTANDQAGWVDTMNVAEAAFPSSELIFSAGDQVESAGNEDQYRAFLAPEQLREIPLVPTNGNHDVGSKAYEQHYTVPNNDPTAGAAGSATSSGGDYWFIYKDVLYLNINTNSSDIAAHKAFMEKVVAEQGANAKWKILAFHHSIYSLASHTNDTKIKDLRAALPTIISDLGIDLVLQGHDHSYTRTYLLKDGILANAKEIAGQAEVEAKQGEVLYVTANSASGSKYYDRRSNTEIGELASVYNQEKVRNYSHIEVTDNSITVETLRSEANGTASPVNSVVDKVTLTRADVVAPVLTVPATGSVEIQGSFDVRSGISAVDAVDGDLTSAITVAGAVDNSKLGDNTLTYSVSDAAGNTSTATRVVTVVEGSFTQVVSPAITGPVTADVGVTLTATPGTFTPAPTSVSYQWLRNGEVIAGAASARYTTVAADAGNSITVRVLSQRAGFADATVTSAAVVIAVAPGEVPDGTPGGAPGGTPGGAPSTSPTVSPNPSSTAAPAAGANGSGTNSGSGSLATTGFDGVVTGSLAAAMLLLGAVLFFTLRRTRRV